MNRDQQRLLKHLGEQIGCLEASCRDFDGGDDSEAIRIASTLRTLLHDTTSSHSLLAQLGYDSHNFLDSCAPLNPVETQRDGQTVLAISGFPGLVAITPTKAGWKYIPPLRQQPESPGFVTFGTWWETDILKDGDGHTYTRHKLVQILTNKEGGGHVDPKLDAQYESMKNGSLGMDATANRIEGFINSPTRTAMRQIAWEILESFNAIANEQP